MQCIEAVGYNQICQVQSGPVRSELTFEKVVLTTDHFIAEFQTKTRAESEWSDMTSSNKRQSC